MMLKYQIERDYSMEAEKPAGASKFQIDLINKIKSYTSLKITGTVLASKPAVSAWIGLALYSCTDDELRKIGKTRPEKSQADIAQYVKAIAGVIIIPAPSGNSKQDLREWLQSISASFQLPPASKLLQYWSRALLYRDLNGLAAESELSITIKPQPDKLSEELPRLRDDFELPRSANPSDPVALLIAFTGGTGQSKATVLLGIPLSYDREASVLVPPPEGAVPFFNREWLEPPDPDATKDAYLGSVPDCDDFFSANPPPTGISWTEYWAYVEAFVRAVTGSPDPLPNLAPIIGKRDTAWKIVKWDAAGASKKIAETYQRAITQAPPLLNAICNKPHPPRNVDLPIALGLSSALLGHIDTFNAKTGKREGFALERSQRVAATAMTQVKKGELLAVNGPPGTGKTSFLRAVIGTEYVQAALRGADPGIILATAATNKAVTNIIESFANIAGPEMESEWSSRWLPHLPSYGWFYPATSRPDEELNGFMVLKRDNGKGGQPASLIKKIAAGQFFIIEQQQRNWMLDAYLDLHRQALGLSQKTQSAKDAALMIQKRLETSVAQMHTLQSHFKKCVEFPLQMEGCRRPEYVWQHELDEHADRHKRLQEGVVRLNAILFQWNEVLESLRESSRLYNLRKRWLYRIRRMLFGDKAGEEAQALQNLALAKMASINPELAAYRTDALDVAERQHAQIAKMLAHTRAQQRTAEQEMQSARTMLGHWQDWRVQTDQISTNLPSEEGLALRGLLAKWAEADFPPDHQLHREFEELLDRPFRFRHFHMAARYWEARWLADVPAPSDTGDIRKALRRAAMLAPVFVATVYTLPGILDEFEFADLLIFDESGQASPEIGSASFAFAKRAIVVGDTYQLKPVWNVGKEADARLKRDLDVDEVDEGFSVSAGSIMKVAQAHTSISDATPGRLGAGIGLVAHYRCRAEIIEYSRRLVYGDGLEPIRIERPPNGQHSFLYPAMAWVSVKQKTGAQKQGGSWVNNDQIREIVHWLEHDRQRIVAHYGVERISDAVALIAPFRAQAIALRKAVTGLLGREEADAMVINTVHALQGAEKPIVAFSLTQDQGGFFVDRDGPNLLNVAVSRAKDCFILFAAPDVLQPAIDVKAAYGATNKAASEPLGILIAYMNEVGKRLYPRDVVVIEAPGKVERISEALGLSAMVIPTGGHFRRLALIGGKLVSEVIEGGEFTVNALKEVSADLRQIDAFYLATDDDDDGEEIAWHVQEVLRSAGVEVVKKILRMRFYSLTPEDVRLARELALPGIDARRVRANVFRSLFDAELHRQLATDDARASRPQLALLQEIAERQKESGHWRVRIDGCVDDKPVVGYVMEENSNAPAQYLSQAIAKLAASKIPRTDAIPIVPRTYRKVVLPRYPAATTAQTLIAAFKRYCWKPRKTTEALNALYLGHAAPKAYGVGEEESSMIQGEAS
jgi:hypothetical protein